MYSSPPAPWRAGRRGAWSSGQRLARGVREGSSSGRKRGAECSKEAGMELYVAFELCGGRSWLTCKALVSSKLEELI